MDNSDCVEVGGDDIPYIAKLFCQKDANNWEELYVGICSVSKSLDGEWCIVMTGRDDDEDKCRYMAIDKATHYASVDEVLLLWKGVFCLYSLSFLDQKYRDSILEQIQNAQSEMVKESLLNSNESLKILSLPPVSVDNLAEIYQTITNAEISQKEVFHSLLSANSFQYLRDLLNLFPILESSNNHERILDLFNLCRLIMELGYDDAVGVIFSEECYENYFGLMEYKPELPHKANYREYFKTQVHFCNTMNEINESLLCLIHKLYRLIYYRDAIDPQPIDDIIPSALSSQITTVISQLVEEIVHNEKFVQELLKNLEGQSCLLSLKILNELFVFCREMSIDKKIELVNAFEQKNYLLSKQLEYQLEHNSNPLEYSLVFTILEYRITYATDSYRQFLIHNKPSPSFTKICNSLCDESHYDIQLICNSILHKLLCVDNLSITQNSQLCKKLVEQFYSTYAKTFLPSITSSSSSAALILQLLSDFESSHSLDIQFFLLRNNLFTAILNLLQSSNRVLHLACFQFISQCINSSVSNWYCKFIMKHDYMSIILSYGEERVSEDSLIMSSFFHLLQLCIIGSEATFSEYVKKKLIDFPKLASLPVVMKMAQSEPVDESQVFSKIPHLNCD